MEVAARDDQAVRDQYQRVVSDGIGFDLKGAARKVQQVHRGPCDLRLAADAIGVLHAGVAQNVAFADH